MNLEWIRKSHTKDPSRGNKWSVVMQMNEGSSRAHQRISGQWIEQRESPSKSGLLYVAATEQNNATRNPPKKKNKQMQHGQQQQQQQQHSNVALGMIDLSKEGVGVGVGVEVGGNRTCRRQKPGQKRSSC